MNLSLGVDKHVRTYYRVYDGCHHGVEVKEKGGLPQTICIHVFNTLNIELNTLSP